MRLDTLLYCAPTYPNVLTAFFLLGGFVISKNSFIHACARRAGNTLSHARIWRGVVYRAVKKSFLSFLLRFSARRKITCSLFLRFRRDAPKNCFLPLFYDFSALRAEKIFGPLFSARSSEKDFWPPFFRRGALGIFLVFLTFTLVFTVFGNYYF